MIPDFRFDLVTSRSRSAIVRRQYLESLRGALAKSAFDIERRAKINITDQDAVDTGALRSSVYVVVPGEVDSYSAASAESMSAAMTPGKKSGRPNRRFKMLPKREPSGGMNALEAIAAVGAEYGIDVELGTPRTRPRPFWEPAVSKTFREFTRFAVNKLNAEVT